MRYMELNFYAHGAEETPWNHEAPIPIEGDIRAYGFIFDYTETAVITDGETIEGLCNRFEFQINGQPYDTILRNQWTYVSDIFSSSRQSDLTGVTATAQYSGYVVNLPKCREGANSMNMHFEFLAATAEFVTPATNWTSVIRPFVIYGQVSECLRLTNGTMTSVIGANMMSIPNGVGPIRHIIGIETDRDTSWIDISDGSGLTLCRGSGSFFRQVYGWSKDNGEPYPQATDEATIWEISAGAPERVANRRCACAWYSGEILLFPSSGKSFSYTCESAEAKTFLFASRYAKVSYGATVPENLIEKGLGKVSVLFNQ